MAMAIESYDEQSYKVVVNEEGQYSIWDAESENPLGWKDDGRRGNKEECLNYIAQVWTDLRPLSLRCRMDAMTTSSYEPNES